MKANHKHGEPRKADGGEHTFHAKTSLSNALSFSSKSRGVFNFRNQGNVLSIQRIAVCSNVVLKKETTLIALAGTPLTH